jgi:hypothetical protein
MPARRGGAGPGARRGRDILTSWLEAPFHLARLLLSTATITPLAIPVDTLAGGPSSRWSAPSRPCWPQRRAPSCVYGRVKACRRRTPTCHAAGWPATGSGHRVGGRACRGSRSGGIRGLGSGWVSWQPPGDRIPHGGTGERVRMRPHRDHWPRYRCSAMGHVSPGQRSPVQIRPSRLALHHQPGQGRQPQPARSVSPAAYYAERTVFRALIAAADWTGATVIRPTQAESSRSYRSRAACPGRARRSTRADATRT